MYHVEKLLTPLVLIVTILQAFLITCTTPTNPANTLDNLGYKTNPARYKLGETISPNVPTYIGSTADTFLLLSALPASLVLDGKTGAISGSAMDTITNGHFLIAARNKYAIDTADLIITIVPQKPESLTYDFALPVYTVNIPIEPNKPHWKKGLPNNFWTDQKLPSGLVLNSQNGWITGKPDQPIPATNFTIRAANEGGTTQVTIYIKVTGDSTGAVINHKPQFTSDLSNRAILGNETLKLVLKATDADVGDLIHYSL